MTSTWQTVVGLAGVIALVLLNGFFVAAEFALVSVRRTRVQQLAADGVRAASRVQAALGRLDLYIAATQLGITMAALGLGSLGEPVVARLITGALAFEVKSHTGIALVHTAAYVVAFLAVTVIDILFGELVPKSIAIQRSERIAMASIGPLNLFVRLFRPLVTGLNRVGGAVLRRMGFESRLERTSVHTVEEIELLVHSSQEAGVLEEQQEQMLAGVLDLQDVVVRKLMTSRLDIVAVEVSMPFEEAVRKVQESGHSRLPVYEGDLDNIVGTLYAKDMLPAALWLRRPSLRLLLRPAIFVPETKLADDLLAEMQQGRMQIAIVRDEYGVVSGVVTLEDLLEEIVGEIQDEHDAEPPPLRMVDEHTAVVAGRMSVGDLADRLEVEIPDDRADTVAGLVVALLGREGEPGDTAEFEHLRFDVEATDGRRITQVRVRVEPQPEPEPVE